MQVVIDNVSKRFGETAALRNVCLTIQPEELFFLLGPSGCGKTTLLRTLAGFYQPDEGAILFGGKTMNGIAPHRRNTGMVFQNYALWPHLTVEENVAYGLEVRAVNARERMSQVHAALEMVQMDRYASRTPNQLSGGQQQRVALARALVIRPDILLLDEPLSNLDAQLRLEMREEIRRIHAQTRITTIYVTHDQKEALSLASRMAVLRDGQLEQVGEPRTIYRSPANRFVADFIGEANWLPGTIEQITATGVHVRTDLGPFLVETPTKWDHGRSIDLGFRPEAVQIGPHSINCIQTTIRSVSYFGDTEQYLLDTSAVGVIKVSEQNPTHLRQAADRLTIHVRPTDCMVLPRK